MTGWIEGSLASWLTWLAQECMCSNCSEHFQKYYWNFLGYKIMVQMIKKNDLRGYNALLSVAILCLIRISSWCLIPRRPTHGLSLEHTSNPHFGEIGNFGINCVCPLNINRERISSPSTNVVLLQIWIILKITFFWNSSKLGITSSGRITFKYVS